jgi:MFS family permease
VQLPLRGALRRRLGGAARARVILLLAGTVALAQADVSAVGASATQLEQALDITHTQLGLLSSISLLVGAAATIPFGVLADRIRRVRVLTIVVALWSVAMVGAGAAPTYGWLLVARLALGGITAAAYPIIASLIGDLFLASERSRIYALIVTGEFAGTLFGVLVSGNLAALSWRYAFWVLVPPSALLAWLLAHRLPEPLRGGASRMAEGDEMIPGVEGPPARRSDPGRSEDVDGAREAVRDHAVEPERNRVLESPRGQLSLIEAVRYVLRVPTNVTLIVASALGYFFFAGLQTFAVAFMRGTFGVGQSLATLLLAVLAVGAVAGVPISGRLADGMLERGRLTARIDVAATGYVAGAVLLLPGLLIGTLPVAMVFFALGAAMLAAPNPPLDAARLDVMPSMLWGRAESIRTVLRQGAQAGAPVLFGLIADALGGAGDQHVGGSGLRFAFMIMLSALVASGAIVWTARRRYPRDVATAEASEPTDDDAPAADPHPRQRHGQGARSPGF